MASVDNLEELIATRKLNGVDDGLFKSDKNVASMTEEAFNEIIDNFEVVAYLTEYGRRGIKENVIKLQARIKELEAEKKKYIVNLTDEQYRNLVDTIKKEVKQEFEQKVKELKESIILGPTIVGGRRNCKTLEYGIKLGKIKACEELLEENK